MIVLYFLSIHSFMKKSWLHYTEFLLMIPLLDNEKMIFHHILLQTFLRLLLK